MRYVLPFGQAHGNQAWRTGPKAARRTAYLGLGTLLVWAFKQAFDLYYLWQMRIVERTHLAALEERLWHGVRATQSPKSRHNSRASSL